MLFSPKLPFRKKRNIMSAQASILDQAKRKIQIEQTVRGFLELMDENELDLEDGLVAWNMLGFTMFQDTYPDENHAAIQQRMAEFSQSLFASGQLS